ncbi:hypothetical protein [Hyalangium gracile]|uniref:hypothetical protein n=1 Tax=Hyalangium gracile TaxID=394092 RepID=UPI001CCFC6FE|nr:hypothetical protein [Hyalangium gracile]
MTAKKSSTKSSGARNARGALPSGLAGLADAGTAFPLPEEHAEFERLVTHALLVDARDWPLFERLDALDPFTRAATAFANANVAVTEQEHFLELALVWIPQQLPVALWLVIGNTTVPGGQGVFRGGKAHFRVPASLYQPGQKVKLHVAYKFQGGGWKYQLWGRWRDSSGAIVSRQLESGMDASPTSPSDDKFIKHYELPPAMVGNAGEGA